MFTRHVMRSVHCPPKSTLFLGLVGVVYLAQLASPLRLDGDSVVLLQMAAGIVDGHGPGHTHFPPGLPLLVALLDRLHAAHPPLLVALNLACLALGVWATDRVFRRAYDFSPTERTLLALVSLLSFVMVKHALIPLSDVPYFGASALALAALTTADQARSRGWWLVGLLLAGVALSVRTIGVALAPAVVWCALPVAPRAWVVAAAHRPRVGWTLLGLLVLAVLVLSQFQYGQEGVQVYRDLGPRALYLIPGMRLAELGSVVVNLPDSRVPSPALLLLPGLVCWAWLVYMLVRRFKAPQPVDVYLAAYLTILAVWPYYGPRFWLPVIPLLWATVASDGLPSFRRMLRAYGVAYALLGLAALAYTTRITFAGSRFPLRYGDGTLTPTYQKAAGLPVAPAKVNADALAVLERYGR